MKTSKLPVLLLCAVLGLTMISCSGSKSAGASASNEDASGSPADVMPDKSNLSLSAYLKKIPGLSVTGSGVGTTIFIQNDSVSTEDKNTPLFVIDNTPVGTDYSAIEGMIDLNDINKVSVLKESSATSEYGLQGANGVIVIKTKKN